MRRYKLPVGQMAFDLFPEEVVQPKQEVPIPQEVPVSTEVLEQVVPVFSFPPLPLALPPAPEPVIPEIIFAETPSVTFHKNGKKLLIRANDVVAADLWREIQDRLDNERMRNMQYFTGQDTFQAIAPEKELIGLWRWILTGLDTHPYKSLLEACGITVHISPSLAGYMRAEKKHIELEKAPFVCYSSSNDDLEQCVQAGMILRATSKRDDFEVGKRYMVKQVTNGRAYIYTDPLQGRTLLSDTAETTEVLVTRLNARFEDADKFVIDANIRDLFPERIAREEAKLAKLDIHDKLFLHVKEDVVTEAPKRGFMCSKEMRMGKSSEALANCEMKGSKAIAWISPTDAMIDTTGEFQKRGIFDYFEVRKMSDLEVPTKYHLFTYDTVKKSRDPLAAERRGQKTRTWLRAMGQEGGHEGANCPHCDQALERPIKTKDALGKIISVSWVTSNGYICRNPECQWEERHWKKKSGSDTKRPTHRGAAWDLGTHRVGRRKCYIDWERMKHAECGELRKPRSRMCSKCGAVDSAWVPPMYKRITKNYATVVVDESHNTKDDTSKASRAGLAFRGRHHILLTGTPMSKDLLDMYYPLMWAMKGPTLVFPFSRGDSMSPFKQRFCEDVLIQREGSKGHYKTLPYPKNPVDLWNFLAPIIVRRTRQDEVYKQSLDELNLKLPTSDSRVTSVKMVPPQAHLMLDSIEKFKEDFAEYAALVEEKGQALNESLVISQMSRMVIAATVPVQLNKKDEPVIYDGGDYDLDGMGGKGIALGALLPAKVMEGNKVVVLSQFPLMRSLIAERFKQLNPVLMLSNGIDKKRALLAEFRKGDEHPVLIAGPKQICQGIDLNCADVMICVDLLWEAAKQQQALNRLMGPTENDRVVQIYTLNSLHSIDEHKYRVFYGKVAGMEQTLDKRVITRTAREVNWKMFVDQVVEQEEAIAAYLREVGNDHSVVLPDFMDDVLLERVV